MVDISMNGFQNGFIPFLLVVFASQVLAWLICFLLCEFKYLLCKRKCQKCGNWQCKFFKLAEEECRKAFEEENNI